MSVTETSSAVRSARDWAKALVVYRQPSAARGIFELIVTFPPFVAVWTAMLLASSHGLFLLSFALAPLAAGLLIRLFLIQHDCGHGSFFPNKHANDWVGRALGVLTVTPYDLWRRTHAIHHASSGNLDRRGIGDIKTLTVREYFARDWRGRLIYRLYRHPLVMFGIGPAYMFLIESRLPFASCARAHAMGQHDDHQCQIALAAGVLILCMGHDVHHRSCTDRRTGRDDGRVVVLRAASIRGDDMGRGDGLEPA
jgi:omega-6 fatty acid desaturase (delta-12 desaturase)